MMLCSRREEKRHAVYRDDIIFLWMDGRKSTPCNSDEAEKKEKLENK